MTSSFLDAVICPNIFFPLFFRKIVCQARNAGKSKGEKRITTAGINIAYLDRKLRDLHARIKDFLETK